jgi:MFS family permease
MERTAPEKIGWKNWTLIWVLGMAGQICWNIENSWFNNFVYDKIAPNPSIVAWMVGVSATVTTFSTFLIGTLSDRKGKRRPFIGIGYILWGLSTIVFGLGEYLPKNPLILAAAFVVLADAVMSFFGSMGNDGGFNAWTTDISHEGNRGRVGGALAVMPILATIFGAVVSGAIIDAIDFFAFFTLMGVLVGLIGVLALFTLDESPTLTPKRDEKGYWHQFFSVFRFKTVIENRELFWVFIVMAVYFIGFNVYFPYITIYFVNYLGFDYTMTGIIQGVGLLAASLLTIPVARIIDRGKIPAVICAAVACNTVGLIVVGFSRQLPFLLIGVLGAGAGYVLVLQALTAWIKNLYPADQRGQFEGIKILFFVCIPMLLGPAIATPVINTFGLKTVVNGVEGMVPTPSLFWISAALTSLTLLPLIVANRLMQRRKSKEV